MTAIRGSVQYQAGGMELFTRFSLKSIKKGSVTSFLEEVREEERRSITDKQWNFKMLRDQFRQRNMEPLYRRYEAKLKLGYLSVFMVIMIIFSLTHLLTILLLPSLDVNKEIPAVICYVLQAIITVIIVALLFVERIIKTFEWSKEALSVILIIFLMALDIVVPAITTDIPPLRSAYYTNTILVCYIFLPLNNYILTIAAAILASVSHVIVLCLVTYKGHPNIYMEVGSDVLYLIATNLIGIYYRVMNEIVSRRSFLDRRACVETTLKLNYEKDQEERLLLSILPEHIAYSIRHDIRNIFQQIQHEQSVMSPVENSRYLYINEHDNVSILYADIVNYTMISTTLPAKILVETLNELFAKFDEAAEEHEVLRIKFLGDCYYCVSGIPNPNPQHAKSCVDLGLDMISIIKEVRESRRLNIDMRIGVHSGKILSGLIGIRKWQYDIWSKDVTIANKMESTGKAGKVHITKRTLEELNDAAKDYIIEPNFESQTDPLLARYKIETFLISNPNKGSDEFNEYKVQFKRVSVGYRRLVKKGTQRGRPSDFNQPRSRTTAFIDNNLMAYRKMLRQADSEMWSIVEEMPSGIWGGYKQYSKDEEGKPLWKWTILFKDPSWEMSFIKQPDLLFKYFVAASLCVLILTMSMQALTIESLTWETLVIDGVLAIILIILQPMTWTQYFWDNYYTKEDVKGSFVKFWYDLSSSIVRNALARSILYISIISLLSVSALINLVECDLIQSGNQILLDENCIPPWHLTQSIFLVLLLTFLFSRVFFLVKWIMGFIISAVYVLIIWELKPEVFLVGASWNYNMDPRIAQTMAVAFLMFTLHVIDRQTEFKRRQDYKWNRKLSQKQEDASTIRIVNNMFLNNILPAHVADIYLNTTRSPEELYYEEYDYVAVMFASLTDYKFTSDDGTEMSEVTLLKFLNQLISDFDKLLLYVDDEGLKVEKIKMAGWTYMAACGLDPNFDRPSLMSSASQDQYAQNGSGRPPIRSVQKHEDEIVLTLIKFAASMNKILYHFNRCSFQEINLRIGISHGEVTAGVVGSSKPLYDIWGHAVNMSSRMDSTGEPGRIQITENTALVLDRQGILTQYRGITYVKGAGYVNTYFVPLDKECRLLHKDTVMEDVYESDEVTVL